jgi:hypothetical protein
MGDVELHFIVSEVHNANGGYLFFQAFVIFVFFFSEIFFSFRPGVSVVMLAIFVSAILVYLFIHAINSQAVGKLQVKQLWIN